MQVEYQPRQALQPLLRVTETVLVSKPFGHS